MRISAGKAVAALVFGVAGVAAHPVELDFVAGQKRNHAPPEILIFDGLALGIDPALLHPRGQPALFDGVVDVALIVLKRVFCVIL